MPEINVSFVHPTDGRVVSVTMDNSMTGQEVIPELIAANFIPPSAQGYMLAIKGGAQIQNAQTLAAAGVKEGDTIRVIPATDAGV
ncbi:MAG: EsaB/YukD family protein [Bacteroidia bacterium]